MVYIFREACFDSSFEPFLIFTDFRKKGVVSWGRHYNPDGRVYTWRKFHSNKQSRLDFFLVSASLLPYVSSANIVPGINSDHSVIDLEIDFSKFNRGRGFWKFNSSLLGDTVYRDLIKTTIKRTTAMYAIIEGNDRFYESASSEELTDFFSSATAESLQHVPLKVNPQSFLDVLLMEIRQETIAYSSKKKRERLGEESKLLDEIKNLDSRLAVENDEQECTLINEELQLKKNNLEEIYSYYAQGAYVRARAQNLAEGEKPTRLFCALEKHNAIQKHVPKLIIETEGREKVLTDQKDIEHQIFKYYRELFEMKPVEEKEITDFLDPRVSVQCPTVTEEQKATMEGLLTTEELTRYPKQVFYLFSYGSYRVWTITHNIHHFYFTFYDILDLIVEYFRPVGVRGQYSSQP